MIIKTDCRSDEGVTVGLIDSIIYTCRVLACRDLSTEVVMEALKDLHSDEDVDTIFKKAVNFLDSIVGEQNIKLNNVYAVLKEKDAIIDQRNNMLSEMSSELELTKVHLKSCREKIWKLRRVIED